MSGWGWGGAGTASLSLSFPQSVAQMVADFFFFCPLEGPFQWGHSESPLLVTCDPVSVAGGRRRTRLWVGMGRGPHRLLRVARPLSLHSLHIPEPLTSSG